MTTNTLGKVAIGVSIVILCGWGFFWGVQVQDTMCLLEASTSEDIPACLENM